MIKQVIPFSRRVRTRARLGSVMFLGGAAMLTINFFSRLPGSAKVELMVVWGLVMLIGAFLYYRSLELPVREVLQLAQSHNGLLTVTEIATELDVSPDDVLRTLRYLASRNLARPSLQQVEKNLWEFPDCMALPLTQAMELAKENDGMLDIQRLMASGISLESAEQTLLVLKARGLLRE